MRGVLFSEIFALYCCWADCTETQPRSRSTTRASICKRTCMRMEFCTDTFAFTWHQARHAGVCGSAKEDEITIHASGANAMFCNRAHGRRPLPTLAQIPVFRGYVNTHDMCCRCTTPRMPTLRFACRRSWAAAHSAPSSWAPTSTAPTTPCTATTRPATARRCAPTMPPE